VRERQPAAQSADGFAVSRRSNRASPGVTQEASIAVRRDADIVVARQQGRDLAARLGFGPTEQTLIATAISELTRNIVLYAQRGRVVLKPIARGKMRGIMVVASDDGPGIANLGGPCRAASRPRAAWVSGCPASAGSPTSSTSSPRSATERPLR